MRAIGWVVALVLAASAAACDAPLEAALGVPARNVGPSPLVGVDPERIYTILHFSDAYVSECRRYFEAPTDPRYVQMGLQCEGNELTMVDWLRVNGFPSVQPEHLREREFWESQTGLRERIGACRRAAFEGPGIYLDVSKRADACDPIERFPKERTTGLPTAKLAGIRVPE